MLNTLWDILQRFMPGTSTSARLALVLVLLLASWSVGHASDARVQEVRETAQYERIMEELRLLRLDVGRVDAKVEDLRIRELTRAEGGKRK